MNQNYIREDRENLVKANDFHVPFHDADTVRLFIKFIEYLQPKYLLLDEVIDFYTISKYSPDPSRKTHIQKDLNIAKHILQRIRVAVPNTTIIMLKSNHDDRLQKYLFTKAPELSKLDCLDLNSLLGLDVLKIEYRKEFVFRGVLFKHGGLVKKNSAETARFEFGKENVSGCSGHTHRLGQFYKTQRNGRYVWLECGCLCKTNNVEYIEGTADWQQGLGLFSFKKNSNHFYPTLIPIINHQLMWGERTFK